MRGLGSDEAAWNLYTLALLKIYTWNLSAWWIFQFHLLSDIEQKQLQDPLDVLTGPVHFPITATPSWPEVRSNRRDLFLLFAPSIYSP
jgi:hypothetical protein